MKVGDILVYIKTGNSTVFTENKQYKICRIDNFIPEHVCGWIKDDNNQLLYFKEEDATNEHWKYLKDIRKGKLEKICSAKD